MIGNSHDSPGPTQRPDRAPIPIAGRLAPSPTGGLHVGHARTFLVAWLSARSKGGKIALRIEDIDASRVRADAAQGMIDDLRWLGFDWDEGPIEQSRRLDLYAAALERLKQAERVYPCVCTRSDIARAASAPHAEDEGPSYPGTCARRSAADADALQAASRKFAWRFRVEPGPVAWNDLARGPVAIDPSRSGGDFVVGRSSGEPSYQLAVVCDDHAMGISEVVRGDDLLASTPRQIQLLRALGGEPPRHGHLPLACDPSGRRLAKRDGSIKLAALRESGTDPRHLVGWLAQSCGWSDRIEPSAPADWTERFDWRRIPREPWIVRIEELNETHQEKRNGKGAEDRQIGGVRKPQTDAGGVGSKIPDAE